MQPFEPVPTTTPPPETTTTPFVEETTELELTTEQTQQQTPPPSQETEGQAQPPAQFKDINQLQTAKDLAGNDVNEPQKENAKETDANAADQEARDIAEAEAAADEI